MALEVDVGNRPKYEQAWVKSLIDFILYTPHFVAIWSVLTGIYLIRFVDLSVVTPLWFKDAPYASVIVGSAMILVGLFRIFAIARDTYIAFSALLSAIFPCFLVVVYFSSDLWNTFDFMHFTMILLTSGLHVLLGPVQRDLVCTLKQ